jgi:hypothetical protein
MEVTEITAWNTYKHKHNLKPTHKTKLVCKIKVSRKWIMDLRESTQSQIKKNYKNMHNIAGTGRCP